MSNFYHRLAKIARSTPPSQQGFSILEIILAIVTVGIALVLIAPPVTLAVATRVQNSRAEQARELAQQEIDRIQAAMARGGAEAESANLPPSAGTVADITAVGAPTTLEASRDDADTDLAAFLVDLDEDGDNDFFVQRFRDDGILDAAGTELSVFRMGVRVYSIIAQDSLGELATEPASLRMVQGLGEQRNRPLAALYTEISQSSRDTSLDLYCQYVATEPDSECN